MNLIVAMGGTECILRLREIYHEKGTIRMNKTHSVRVLCYVSV